MIMPRGRQLLLPVNPLFIAATLVLALLLAMLPLGRQPALPDVVAVVLVFWSVHQPRYVGVVTAFLLGLVIDVHHGALLGQHALAYSIMSYFAVALHRRLRWFGLGGQTVQVWPLFAVGHAVQLLLRLLAGDAWPGWPLLLAPAAEALLWPLVSVLLLAPQRRAPDPDANRPL